MIAQAAGGPISVTGEPDRPPVKPGLSFGDTGTGMLMAATILGALARAQPHRPGPAAASGDAGRDDPLHAHLLCDDGAHRQGGAAPRRQAVAPATTRPPASTRPRAAAPTTISTSPPAGPIPSTVTRLMKLIGREELIDDPRFATGDARVQNAEELDAIIGEWTRSTTSARRWRS